MHAVRFRFPFDPAGSRIFDPGVLYYRGSLFTEAAALLYLCSTKCLPLASVIASSVGLLASFSCLVRLVSSVCVVVLSCFFLSSCVLLPLLPLRRRGVEHVGSLLWKHSISSVTHFSSLECLDFVCGLTRGPHQFCSSRLVAASRTVCRVACLSRVFLLLLAFVLRSPLLHR